MSRDANGNLESYEIFSLSHDAFAQKHDTNPIGLRIGEVLRKAGIIQPTPSTRDKVGREQILYDFLKGRIKTGEVFNDSEGRTEPVMVAKLQIADTCVRLIRAIPSSPRDEKNMEEIAEFLGDDPIAGAGYGLYAMFGKPAAKPLEVRVAERLETIKADPTQVLIQYTRILNEEKRKAPRSIPMRKPHRTWGRKW